jgi:hypothetical protein
MGFQEFLAEGPIEYLLGFLAITGVGVVLLTAFLVISFFSRRSKKQKEELGLHSRPSAFANPPDRANNPPVASGPAPEATPEAHLDLDILSRKAKEQAMIKRDAETTPEQKINLAARLDTAQSPAAPTPAQEVADEPVELLRLLRDPQTGQLVVEIGENRYTKLTEITDKEVGQFVLKLTAHLLAFTGGVIVTNKGMKSVYTPKVSDVPEPVAPPRLAQPAVARPPEQEPAESLVPRPSPEAEAAFRESLKAMTLPSPPEPAAPRQKSGLFNLGKPSEPSPATPALNLAGEINDIVQIRLRYSPLGEHNVIEITSDPGGSIRINVNNKIYASPDDIQDTEVRDLIKASIKEWERS